MKRNNVVSQIENIKSLPPTKQPQFYANELGQIIEKYAPNYPNCTEKEMFAVWTAIFDLGWLKGKSHEARRLRQSANRATENAPV